MGLSPLLTMFYKSRWPSLPIEEVNVFGYVSDADEMKHEHM